jgi:hypothetical protein
VARLLLQPLEEGAFTDYSLLLSGAPQQPRELKQDVSPILVLFLVSFRRSCVLRSNWWSCGSDRALWACSRRC